MTGGDDGKREWNVAAHLAARAQSAPDSPALFLPNSDGGHTKVTFAELNDEVDRLAYGLRAYGVEPGQRVAMLVPPSLEFFALTFALLRMGAVLVLVDPGIGPRYLKQCLGEATPATFIGIPKAQWARRILGWARDSVERAITVGRTGAKITLDEVWARGVTLLDPPPGWTEPSPVENPYVTVQPEDPAAILFTSGSTGPPKGALYTHRIFATQVDWIRETYAIEPGEIDLPTFPLFGLFDPALGMAAVIPRMDFTRPGRVDPAELVGPIERYRVTNMFGSPAVIRRLGEYVASTGRTLPTLRRVLSAGAPASPPDLERFRRALSPDADVHTPYGATEALPVSTIAAEEIIAESDATRDGAGICIGRPLPGVTLEVIEITDAPIERWDQVRILGPGEIGEFVVKGPMVTREYFERPEATRLAKITDGEEVRHRMGDVGYLDDQGRMWFCGRKSHRVRTAAGDRFTDRCEGIYNVHPKVRRTALVGIPDPADPSHQRPVLCVEPERHLPRRQHEAFLAEVRALGADHPETRDIELFLVHPSFPVDIRHNSKIFREKLAVWAAKRLDRGGRGAESRTAAPAV